jgi:Fe2+ transport system protein FeoA
VVNLSPAIVGGERRRMLDLGLVPGTRIERDFASMLGSPVAYRVRGATIALRKEQSDRIFVEA